MKIKNIAKKGYNSVAETWHKSRLTTLENCEDIRLLKQNRPHLFVEKPAMESKLPDLSGKTVLCLGCGSGEESRMILRRNPRKLVGVDIAEKLISIAKESVDGAEFYCMDAENLKFKDSSFDYVYSSLMLDYFESWEKVMSEVYRILRNGGVFLFSNLHPVKWSAERVKDSDGKATESVIGFRKDIKSGEIEIKGNYLGTILHNEVWNNGMRISYYTKPISLMFKEVRNAGFNVIDIDEPKAIAEAKKHDIGYWGIKQKIPDFVIFECQKP